MSNRTKRILIGIDGGGTGCRVAVATAEGEVLGAAKGGPANPTYQQHEALSNILAAIEAARQDAGLDNGAIASACAFVGLAGIRDNEIAQYIASALPMAKARVVEDRITTVTGALSGNDGAVAAIGTGSFVAHSLDNNTQYVGGWGFRLGDQASGAWLGQKLLKRAVLCAEGIEGHTALTRQTLALYDDTNEIYDFCNEATPAEFGNLAPLVVTAAADGDQTATALMRSGADYIVKALATLGYQPTQALCLTGGLGPHYAAFLPPSYAAQVVKPKGTALDGALLLAAQMETMP